MDHPPDQTGGSLRPRLWGIDAPGMTRFDALNDARAVSPHVSSASCKGYSRFITKCIPTALVCQPC